MATIRFAFTKKSIQELESPTSAEVGSSGYIIVWDTRTTGLGLVLRPSGTKTFILAYRDRLGRPKRLTLGKFGRLTVDQAREGAVLNNGKIALGEDPQTEKQVLRATLTFGEVFKLYRDEHLKLNASADAYRSAGAVLKQLPDEVRNKLPAELEQADILAVLSRLTARPGTYNAIRSYVSACWTWARPRKLVPKNSLSPTTGISPKPSKAQGVIVSRAQYARILRAIETLIVGCRHDPNRLLALAFIAETGCRPIEALRLKKAMIDRENGVALLEEHKMAKRVNEPKVFRLTPNVLRLIERAEALHNAKGITSPYVFPPKEIKKSQGWLKKGWEAVSKLAEVDIDMRQLRSGFINLAFSQGLDAREVANLTGHKSLQVLDRHYRKSDTARTTENALAQAAIFDHLRSISE